MAFKSVGEMPRKRIKRLGQIEKAVKHDGFYLKIDPDCDLILYVPESGEYFKVLKVPVKVVEEGAALFTLSVDLDKPVHVEFKTKD